MTINWKFACFTASIAAAGLALTGCGSSPSPPSASPRVGYISGVAFPCIGVGRLGPGATIELAILGPAARKFVEPVRWSAGDYRFRFPVAPGNYRIYEDQRFAGSYERVGGPFSANVTAERTTKVTVGNGCK